MAMAIPMVIGAAASYTGISTALAAGLTSAFGITTAGLAGALSNVIIGAVGGALSSAVMGGNPLTGALFGGLGAGLAGAFGGGATTGATEGLTAPMGFENASVDFNLAGPGAEGAAAPTAAASGLIGDVGGTAMSGANPFNLTPGSELGVPTLGGGPATEAFGGELDMAAFGGENVKLGFEAPGAGTAPPGFEGTPGFETEGSGVLSFLDDVDFSTIAGGLGQMSKAQMLAENTETMTEGAMDRLQWKTNNKWKGIEGGSGQALSNLIDKGYGSFFPQPFKGYNPKVRQPYLHEKAYS